MKPLLVTNFSTHYRAPLFERLQRELGMEFIFYSAGDEDYWQPHLGTTKGGFRADTIVGREVLPKIRVNPSLLRALLVRDYDVLIKCINGRLELPTAYVAAKLRRKPFILWTSFWAHPVSPFHRVSVPVLRHMYRGADAIVTDGQHISDFAVAQGAEAPKVFTAALAVDNDLFSSSDAGDGAFRAAAGADGRPLILSVARLVPEKGLDVLLSAAARLHDIKPVVAVVGTGDLGPELGSLARALGVDLYLAGGLQPAEMPAVYREADVVALSSVTTNTFKEPWGLAVNEAMCSGVPVVTSDAVGAAAGGLVVHGVTGLIVPERNDAALAQALRRVLTSREFANRLVENARQRVSRTTQAAMVESYAAALAFVAAKRRSPGMGRPL